MENEGLKEGARPRIQMHPPKMGDRRWEEHVAGAESGSRKSMPGDFKLSGAASSLT